MGYILDVIITILAKLLAFLILLSIFLIFYLFSTLLVTIAFAGLYTRTALISIPLIAFSETVGALVRLDLASSPPIVVFPKAVGFLLLALVATRAIRSTYQSGRLIEMARATAISVITFLFILALIDTSALTYNSLIESYASRLQEKLQSFSSSVTAGISLAVALVAILIGGGNWSIPFFASMIYYLASYFMSGLLVLAFLLKGINIIMGPVIMFFSAISIYQPSWGIRTIRFNMGSVISSILILIALSPIVLVLLYSSFSIYDNICDAIGFILTQYSNNKAARPLISEFLTATQGQPSIPPIVERDCERGYDGACWQPTQVAIGGLVAIISIWFISAAVYFVPVIQFLKSLFGAIFSVLNLYLQVKEG